jgi:hypothetical protein
MKFLGEFGPMHTLKFTDQDIAVVKQLIIAAGKSPHTGDAGMMTAAHYIQMIDQQIAEAGKPASNGHAVADLGAQPCS